MADPKSQPTLLQVLKMVRDQARQGAAMLARLLKLEHLVLGADERLREIELRLGKPARPKDERLSREEWLARRREAVKHATAKRWTGRKGKADERQRSGKHKKGRRP